MLYFTLWRRDSREFLLIDSKQLQNLLRIRYLPDFACSHTHFVDLRSLWAGVTTGLDFGCTFLRFRVLNDNDVVIPVRPDTRSLRRIVPGSVPTRGTSMSLFVGPERFFQ
jgi:hypothetical protein